MTPSTPTLIRDPWRRVWQSLAGDAALAAVLSVLAGLLAFMALLPQTPSNDLVAYSRWLSETQQRFGALAAPLTSLGLFNIGQSVLFRLALAALGVIGVVRFIDQFDQLRAINRQSDRSAPPIGDQAIEADLTAAPDRFARRAALAGLIAYGGILIVLSSLALGAFVDVRIDNLSVEPGTLTALPGMPYALRLDGVDGEQAALALLAQTEVIAQGEVTYRQPLAARGFDFYLQSIGPAVIVSATNPAGRPLGLQSTADSPPQPEKLVAFTPDRTEGFVAAPDADLVLQIAPREDGYAVQVYRSPTGESLASRDVSAGEAVTVNETTFHFRRAAFVAISAVRQPSHWLMLPGAILLVLGVIGAGVWRPAATETGEVEKSDRVGGWPQRVILIGWLLGTALLAAGIIGAYPLTARLDGAQPLPAWMGAWLALTGAVLARRRGVRLELIAASAIAGAIALIA